MPTFKLEFLFVLLMWPVFSSYTAVNVGEDTLKTGNRSFPVLQKTSDGTPVIHMWDAKTPTRDRGNAVGFPLLEGAAHFEVWKPTNPSDGAFNHYASLIFHDGLFYAMWANHPYGESCAGQRILSSTSQDGRVWSPPVVLFPAPGPVLAKGENGINMTPDRWVEIDGKLYAVIYVHGAGIRRYPVASQVSRDGSRLDETILLPEIPDRSALPCFITDPVVDPVLGGKINHWYQDNGILSWWAHTDSKSTISWWAQPNSNIPAHAVDGAKLIELFSFRSDKGVVAFGRDYSSQAPELERKSSNRLYVIFEKPEGGWSEPFPTNIPDSHSRSHALRLPDGRVLLAGNQTAHIFDKGIYRIRDPLTLAVSPGGETFTRVFALRSGGDSLPGRRFTGLTGTGPAGYAYPAMTVHDEVLYVIYSVNKEDIAITIVPLDSLTEK